MNTTDPANQLVSLYESGRTFEFIACAHRVLETSPSASGLASLTLRALMEAGLGGPARELLQLCPALSASPAEAKKLREALHDLPNGRVAWSQCADTYRRNEEALLRHRPHLQEAVRKLPAQLVKVHLHRTCGGDCFVSRRSPGALREWLYCLSTTPAEENVQLPPRGQLGSAAVVGLRCGKIVERLFADTSRLLHSFSLPLYFVEPDEVRFAAWMHVADHTAQLEDERVYVFVGKHAAEELGHVLAGDANLATPSLFVNQTGRQDPATAVQRCAAKVEAARAADLAELQGALERRYGERDAAYWARRFRRPGTVLGLTSRYTTMLQYSMRDTLAALGRRGWQTEMLIEAKDHHQFSPITLCKRIWDVDPDLVVFLDHLRYENPYLPKNLPLLAWIQDPMPNLLCRRAGESVGPYDFVCGYYKTRCVEEFGYPEDHFVPTVIPVSETMFHAGPLEEEAKARYACDVSFVSNASEPIGRYHQRALLRYPPPLHPMLEALYRRVREILDAGGYLSYPEGAPQLVRSVARDSGVRLDGAQVEQIKNDFAYRLFDWGRRQQTLEWVADWARRSGKEFRIYGRGWENHPTLAGFARGVIDHGEPLRSVIRASRLALQLIPSGFRHQRSYELLASGTLPLTRYCEADFEFLPIEEYVRLREAGRTTDPASTAFPRLERVVFRTPEEFEALAERFLADDDYREEVLAELRAVVLRDHTYASVVGKVVDHIRLVLRQQAEAACGGNPPASPDATEEESVPHAGRSVRR